MDYFSILTNSSELQKNIINALNRQGYVSDDVGMRTGITSGMREFWKDEFTELIKLHGYTGSDEIESIAINTEGGAFTYAIYDAQQFTRSEMSELIKELYNAQNQ